MFYVTKKFPHPYHNGGANKNLVKPPQNPLRSMCIVPLMNVMSKLQKQTEIVDKTIFDMDFSVKFDFLVC